MSSRTDAVEGAAVRVLYCEGNTDGTVGGSHFCLLHLIQHLDRSRFNPLVVFYDDHVLVPKFRALAETRVHNKDAPVQWAAASGSRGLTLLPTLARRAVNLGKLARKIAGHVAFLKQHRIGLIHLNNSITRHHDWMAAAILARVPCIVHERGLPKYGWIDRWLGRRMALIIPVSRWVGRAMVAQGVAADNIRVMYDGLDAGAMTASEAPSSLRATWGVRPDQPVVGIVGNIRHWKGQEVVVQALIEVTKAHPDVVCFFVGAATPQDQPYVDRLEGLIAKAGINHNVRFTGYQRNVTDFVAMMRFVVHASVEPEPFGMVVLEAMALRKAVIGSRAGGVVEMVVEGETGFTFQPGDASALAARMNDLLNDPVKADDMGKRGYDRLVTTFSMRQFMASIHNAYGAVCARQPVQSIPVTFDL